MRHETYEALIVSRARLIQMRQIVVFRETKELRMVMVLWRPKLTRVIGLLFGQNSKVVMRYLFGFLCVSALCTMPLFGCSETAGDGGSGGTAGDGGSGGTAGNGGSGGTVAAGGTGGSGGSGGADEVTCPGAVVGDRTSAPTIEITAARNTGDRRIEGVARNIDAREMHVVLWAKTDKWYVQPRIASPTTEVCSDGSWSNWSDAWSRMVALLVDNTYVPGATRTYHPSTDAGVNAWDEWPEKSIDRVVTFGGYQWRVKSAEDLRAGPGPNFFSDSDEDVWVDANGLHLTTVERAGKWYCTEVVLQQSLGYGAYEFRLGSRVDNMDHRAVFGAFVYESESREIDIEFSRILADPQNAQYVVQPWNRQGNLSRFTVPARAQSSHRFVWSESSISFTSWVGHEAYPPSAGDVIYQWDYQGPDIPPPGAEGMRFNLWLFDGKAPDGGQGDEVVVESFSFGP